MSSETWPRSGSMRNGIVYPLPPSAPLTSATVSSSSPVSANHKAEFPTPTASTGEKGGRGDLTAQLKTGQSSRRRDWPTPVARDHKGPGYSGQLPTTLTGLPNPEWVEWLMGFPPGWTDCDHWETPLFPRWPNTSDDS